MYEADQKFHYFIKLRYQVLHRDSYINVGKVAGVQPTYTPPQIPIHFKNYQNMDLAYNLILNFGFLIGSNFYKIIPPYFLIMDLRMRPRPLCKRSIAM